MTVNATHHAIDAVWRIEQAKVIAGLARLVRDVGLAEELAQDALVAALEQWPAGGIPENPGAWLMATAKHRAIDTLRRRALHARKEDEISREVETLLRDAEPDVDATLDEDIGDDLLRLIFTACHPILSMEARVALTLRLVGGLAAAGAEAGLDRRLARTQGPNKGCAGSGDGAKRERQPDFDAEAGKLAPADIACQLAMICDCKPARHVA